MDMTDQELEQLLASVKRVAMRIVRPLALAVLAYVLSYTQGHFNYPTFTLALLVFVLSASTYASNAAYAVVFYLAFLVLVPPDVAVSLNKGLAAVVAKIP